MRTTSRNRHRAIRRALAAGILAIAVAAPAMAGTPYNPRRAGNPVRIAAYAVNPFGVLIDYILLRPAWWIGQQEPFKTLFGVTD